MKQQQVSSLTRKVALPYINSFHCAVCHAFKDVCACVILKQLFMNCSEAKQN